MKKLLVLMGITAVLAGCGDKEQQLKPVTTEQQNNEEGHVLMNEKMLGKWQGEIEIPQMPLEIIINLQKGGGSITVPAQNLTDFPFESVQYKGEEIKILINLAGSVIKIAGKFDGEYINGTFAQNGQTFPVKFKAYEEEVITYEKVQVPVEGGILKVALQMPEQPTGELVIIQAGSGPTNKDGNTVGGGRNNSLKMLAEGLAEKGIASVRFDKRGIGENMALIAKEEDLTIDQLVGDVSDIITFFKQDKRFQEVHLIGHSEGALIMTLAAQNNNVKSLTSLAGTGRRANVRLEEQLKKQLPPNLMQQSQQILEKLLIGERVKTVPVELQSLFRPSVQPYFISWLKYDPKEEIGKVQVPVLIVQGRNDIQVTVEDAELLKAGNSVAKIVYFDEMNHILKETSSNFEQNLASYSNPELPLANGLLDEIIKIIQ
ncbi:alpha/beta hydrolase [Solibacillus sp. R5-41]|uniref:alpha/beta fold hydrolase n=1 Tax=Solibacillus sp. R5-41 TaxID=2048654 RepID=UPI000C125BDB|nr:alpha/beta fold hydrolase [Solibacillus sp. R5-41]ATP42164.1 alpha/beta hydrolase [Solibacillus sp. R5-41]